MTLPQFTELINIRSNMKLFYDYFEEIVTLYKLLDTNNIDYSQLVIKYHMNSSNAPKFRVNILCNDLSLLDEISNRIDNKSFMLFGRMITCKSNKLNRNNSINIIINKEIR